MSFDKILFSLIGRIGRLTFWMVMIPTIVITILFNGAIDEMLDYDARTGALPLWAILAALLVSISLAWIYFATVIKRLHDRDIRKMADPLSGTDHRYDLGSRRAWLPTEYRGAQSIWPRAQRSNGISKAW